MYYTTTTPAITTIEEAPTTCTTASAATTIEEAPTETTTATTTTSATTTLEEALTDAHRQHQVPATQSTASIAPVEETTTTTASTTTTEETQTTTRFTPDIPPMTENSTTTAATTTTEKTPTTTTSATTSTEGAATEAHQLHVPTVTEPAQFQPHLVSAAQDPVTVPIFNPVFPAVQPMTYATQHSSPLQADSTITPLRPLPLPLVASPFLQMLTDDDLESGLGPGTPTRQAFDFESSFSEMFRSPNMTERKFLQTLDRKLDALNKKQALNNRLLREQNEKLKYILQLQGNRPAPATDRLNDEEDGLQAESLSSEQCLPEFEALPLFQAASRTNQTDSSVLTTSRCTTTSAVLRQASNIDKFQDIPAPYRLTPDQLRKLKARSKSVGIFATRVLVRLFPELFGEDNLRKKYNYYGFRADKTELDRQRKTYFQRYILYMYPELQDSKAFQRSVVSAVNEYLRRPNIVSADVMF